jgi:N-acylneuraminate cytidylyltransferase
MKAEGFRQAGHRFFGRTAVYEMPFERCIEIDDPVDLVVAEAMLGHAGRERKLAKLPETVSALVMDFDGVFTDNRVLVMEDGREGVLASRGDGLGLDRLRDLELPMLVLSTEENAVVRARCRKLRLESLQGIRDKGEALQQWLNGNGLDPAETVYVGNDINDLDCLRIAGCGVVVRDAHPDALQVADIVLDSSGGYGAVREICDLIYKQHGG